jgi:hypothetical protein
VHVGVEEPLAIDLDEIDIDDAPWPEEEEGGAGIFMDMLNRERTSLHEM